MHVNAKKIAMAGLLAAFSAVLVILSAVIETNSLFLIAAASFGVGIAVREWGVRFGAAFLTASILLNFLVAPNKLYCITFGAMGIYIFISELIWEKIAGAEKLKKRTILLWVGKYITFNCMYLPAILFFPSLIFAKKFADSMIWMMFLAGQAGLFVFDRGYVYFQCYIWGKLRKKLMK